MVTVAAVAVGTRRSPAGPAPGSGDAPVRPAVLRNIVGGVLAMAITYGIGYLVGVGLG